MIASILLEKAVFSVVMFEITWTLVSRMRMSENSKIKYFDHGNVAEDGGEDEHPDEEVPGHKAELIVVVWLRQGRLPDLGKSKSGPVEAVAILRGQGRISL